MEHNCNFNKCALLTDIRRILWRMDQYKEDAEKADHPLCRELLSEMEQDLKRYSKKLEQAITGLAKEDKFVFSD